MTNTPPKATERNSVGHKWCPMHKGWTPLNKFSLDKSRSDGLQRVCKACYSVYRGSPEKLQKRRYRNQKSEVRPKLLWERAKYRALSKNIPFNIEVRDIVIPEMCPILRVPLLKAKDDDPKKGPRYNSPSLDRIDPKKGYVQGNIQVISNKANVMKNDASPAELRRFASWVVATYGDESI